MSCETQMYRQPVISDHKLCMLHIEHFTIFEQVTKSSPNCREAHMQSSLKGLRKNLVLLINYFFLCVFVCG